MSALVLALAAGLGAAPAYAVCAAEEWSIAYWGMNATTAVAVSSGESCQLNGNTGGTGVMNSVWISTPPQQGTARVGDDNSVWYQSNPGYVGPDSFAFSINGSGPGGSGTSTITAGVTVQ